MTIAIATIALSFIVTALTLWIYQIWDRQNRRLPPGPFHLPVIGNLWQIAQIDSKYPAKAFLKLSKKYGDVMFLKLGVVNLVVISGYESLKTILNQEEFMDRFDHEWFIHRSFGKQIGLMAAPTELWKPTRKFTARHLRDFGFGRKHFQQKFIDTEMNDLNRILDEAIENNNGIVKPHTLFQIPTINIAWASAAGRRFDHKDPKIIKLVNLMSEFLQKGKIMEGIGVAYPFLIKWFPKYFNVAALEDTDAKMHVFLRELIDNIREGGNYKIEPNSFVEAFLQAMESEKHKSDEDRAVFNEETLITILYDLFLAGSDTTSSTLTFAIKWLTMYREVQIALRHELDTVIGSERLATLDDKINLPYARAVILELHRINCIVPVAPRKVYKDTPLGNYIIPKNTMVLGSLYSSVMDEDVWGDPENFRPTRFLDDKNNIINAERVMPFSTGRRNCIGEVIAESTIFAFVTQLVQRYDFLPARDGQKFATQQIPGAVMSTPVFEVLIRRRL